MGLHRFLGGQIVTAGTGEQENEGHIMVEAGKTQHDRVDEERASHVARRR